MEYIDSQILINSLNESRKKYDIKHKKVSSVAVSEFLGVYLKDDTTKAKFYPCNRRGLIQSIQEPINIVNFFGKKHSFQSSKRHTDKITISFNGQYREIIEYGSYALTWMINNQDLSQFSFSLNHLSKQEQKSIFDKMRYLIEQNIICTPLSEDIIETALYILSNIPSKINMKKNFRNSFNDLLILSTAHCNQSKLISEDTLLRGEISSILDANTGIEDASIIKVASHILNSTGKINNQESKGYINKSWQYHIK